MIVINANAQTCSKIRNVDTTLALSRAVRTLYL